MVVLLVKIRCQVKPGFTQVIFTSSVEKKLWFKIGTLFPTTIVSRGDPVSSTNYATTYCITLHEICPTIFYYLDLTDAWTP